MIIKWNINFVICFQKHLYPSVIFNFRLILAGNTEYVNEGKGMMMMVMLAALIMIMMVAIMIMVHQLGS